MIKKEYQRLLKLLAKSENLKEFNLEETLKEAVVFFEELRKTFSSAPKEEKEEMIQMMTTLHEKLQQISKKTADESGMTEEELAIFAENPSNFTPEQWQLVQESKRKLYDSARQFSSSVSSEERKPKADVEAKKPRKKTAKRKSRKDWMKS